MDGLGIISLALGVAAVPVLLYYLPVLGITVAVIATTLGIIGIHRCAEPDPTRRLRGFSWAGTALGAWGWLMAVLILSTT